MLLDRSQNRCVVGTLTQAMQDLEFETLYPMLFAHLTSPTWSDGTTRQLSTVTLFADGGVVKCLLKDREMGLCLWASCPTITNVFAVLETLLLDPQAEWRMDRVVAGGKASRVKK